MLTAQQQGLFNLLGWEQSQEQEIRQRHKTCVKEYGAVRDFTRWLTKVLHRQWAEERRKNTTPYLGD